ncbi:NAD-dependent epimerase/dehydratase family protein [Nocardiopsis sp. NPDC058631]|uniref:NAD-dependent epimerase/dehydratase family protein n=1 Tax=Nocardiopsis sp. NPDC058631 TaxID=3346566 RepID=UPI00364E21D5
MAVLVIGGSGFLGREAVRQSLATGHRVAATYRTRRADTAGAAWSAVDIRDRRQVAELVTAVQPDVVINAAFRQTAAGAVGLLAVVAWSSLGSTEHRAP